jgi:hypothetical protein
VETSEYQAAVAAYRAVLEAWIQQLPRVRGWLLTEKCRLEAHRQHAQLVSRWMDVQRQTMKNRV